MAALGIPSPYRASLLWLAELPPEDVDALAEAVGRLEPFSPISTIENAARDALHGHSSADVTSAITALLSLRGQFRHLGADDAARGVSESTDLDLADEARRALYERARSILEGPAFSTTSIAIDLQTQHDRNFAAARIFTDVRPVFSEDVGEQPAGAVIVEMLELQTWDRNGTNESIFVALDERDLTGLREVVDRALDKTRTVRGLLDAQGLTYFQLDAEGE